MRGKKPYIRQPKEGEKYGRLKVLNSVSRVILCECDCGTVLCVNKYKILSGHTLSCGCLRSELMAKKNFRHGLSTSPTYSRWQAMIRRCYRPTSQDYSYYGGRGIVVCDRWHNYAHFLKDVGEAPEGKTLDRINNDGNYEPSNCRWSTPAQSMRNTRQTIFMVIDGVKMCLKDVAKLKGIEYGTLLYRFHAWKNCQSLFTQPTQT